MNNITKLMLSTALVLTVAAPVQAQNVPEDVRNDIAAHYALYAEAYNGLQQDGAREDLRAQMNDERQAVEQLCASANFAQVSDCIAALIPMQNRTEPDRAFGEANNSDADARAAAEAEAAAQAEAQAQAQAEADAAAQAEAEQQAQAEAEAAAQAAAEQQAQAEAEAAAQAAAEQQAQAEAEAAAQAAAEQQAQAEAEAAAQAAAEQQAQAEAEAAAQAAAEQQAQAEAEAAAQAAAEQQAQAEAEAAAQAAAEQQAQAEAEAAAQAEAEQQAQAEAEAAAQAEAEQQAQAEAEAAAQAAAEQQAQAEAEAAAQAAAEQQAQAEAEAAAQAAAEQQAQAEAEAAQAEAEAQAQAEADAAAQAEQEAEQQAAQDAADQAAANAAAQAAAEAAAQAIAESQANAEAEAAQQAAERASRPQVSPEQAVRQAANAYSEAVENVNRAIENGRNNPRRLVNAANTARADLGEACQEAGFRRIRPCLNQFGIEVPEMAAVTVREDSDDENAAALLDSQKDDENAGRQNQLPFGLNFTINLPSNDADSQADIRNQQFFSVEQERGTRIDRQRFNQQQFNQRRPGEVVQDFGDRQVVVRDNQLFIQNNDNDRLNRNASQTYYEDISRDRVRETIVRPNGVRLVTIYNANGDILQRSRFSQDGTETVLIYVAQDQEQQLLDYSDPGEDLPPLQLGISADEYILDADEADLGQVIDFLDSPPVENVTRYYSVDEVKRSARIRDMVRRLEIGNLTFDFGSPNLAPDQVDGLFQLASAILGLLQQNPGEIFLIEGHTDAIGSNEANLLLSDQRSESVANILSTVYGIPPENLATQGYGERYLKINTPNEERLNRRVTVKRITPLVAPVNTAAAG